MGSYSLSFVANWVNVNGKKFEANKFEAESGTINKNLLTSVDFSSSLDGFSRLRVNIDAVFNEKYIDLNKLVNRDSQVNGWISVDPNDKGPFYFFCGALESITCTRDISSADSKGSHRFQLTMTFCNSFALMDRYYSNYFVTPNVFLEGQIKDRFLKDLQSFHCSSTPTRFSYFFKNEIQADNPPHYTLQGSDFFEKAMLKSDYLIQKSRAQYLKESADLHGAYFKIDTDGSEYSKQGLSIVKVDNLLQIFNPNAIDTPFSGIPAGVSKPRVSVSYGDDILQFTNSVDSRSHNILNREDHYPNQANTEFVNVGGNVLYSNDLKKQNEYLFIPPGSTMALYSDSYLSSFDESDESPFLNHVENGDTGTKQTYYARQMINKNNSKVKTIELKFTKCSCVQILRTICDHYENEKDGPVIPDLRVGQCFRLTQTADTNDVSGLLDDRVWCVSSVNFQWSNSDIFDLVIRGFLVDNTKVNGKLSYPSISTLQEVMDKT